MIDINFFAKETPSTMTKDEFYMGKALAEAKTAYAVGEIPTGAVISMKRKSSPGPITCAKACPVQRPTPNCWPLKKPAAPSIAGA